ncbi:Hypothetical predicted protein [Paramuricea clavata]|uniref:DUF5641 domain-containing protein n=1 Tax=Paramuricea clavata TaxID=317549 RepID=A0A7D9D9W0_PARCT|nr:Hypothetical predicted protein [Paramuricea clavata]
MPENQPITKRSILSRLGRVYDPLGMVSPTMAEGKHIFRDACEERKGWSAEVSESLKRKWIKWIKWNNQMKNVKVPRAITKKSDVIEGIQLHLFADASNLACCAATVAVVEHKSGTVKGLESVVLNIESNMNNHPLTYVECDGGEKQVLTPNILIRGENSYMLDDVEDEEDELTKMQRRLRKAKDDAWKRWKREYVHSLLESQRVNFKVVEAPHIGDVVLVVGEEKNRGEWKKGKVLRQVRGKDADFKRIVQNTVGGFMSGVDSQTARIQYRDDEKTFVTMMDDSDLKDAIRCLTAVPNTDGMFRMCVRVHNKVTPIGKNRNASKTNTTNANGIRSCSPDLNRSRLCNQSWIDRIKPTNEKEENEQLRLALSANYAENECQHERGHIDLVLWGGDVLGLQNAVLSECNNHLTITTTLETIISKLSEEMTVSAAPPKSSQKSNVICMETSILAIKDFSCNFKCVGCCMDIDSNSTVGPMLKCPTCSTLSLKRSAQLYNNCMLLLPNNKRFSANTQVIQLSFDWEAPKKEPTEQEIFCESGYG